MNTEVGANNLANGIKEMKRGLLEFVVLKSIDAEPTFPDELHKFLSKTEFSCPKGTLYPLLRKLLNQKLITQCRDESDSGYARKYYFITKTGASHLNRLNTYWKSLIESIEKITPPFC